MCAVCACFFGDRLQGIAHEIDPLVQSLQLSVHLLALSRSRLQHALECPFHPHVCVCFGWCLSDVRRNAVRFDDQDDEAGADEKNASQSHPPCPSALGGAVALKPLANPGLGIHARLSFGLFEQGPRHTISLAVMSSKGLQSTRGDARLLNLLQFAQRKCSVVVTVSRRVLMHVFATPQWASSESRSLQVSRQTRGTMGHRCCGQYALPAKLW
jgi:hypothetical protein